jgi:hypothetical protein
VVKIRVKNLLDYWHGRKKVKGESDNGNGIPRSPYNPSTKLNDQNENARLNLPLSSRKYQGSNNVQRSQKVAFYTN